MSIIPTIGAFEAKTHFSALLERVEHGEEITITRHGKAIARLLPVENNTQDKKLLAAIALKKIRNSIKVKNKTDYEEWKKFRTEGQK